MRPLINLSGPGWPQERGWYAIAMFVQTNAIIALMAFNPSLLEDKFFQVIANSIIVTGWVGFLQSLRESKGERAQDQLDDSLSLNRAAVRALSKQDTERGVATPLQGT